jgi:hypothetical protein
MNLTKGSKNNMKYRIQEIVDGNGESTFTVQYKILWWWENHSRWLIKHKAENVIRSAQTKEVKYHTLEQ